MSLEALVLHAVKAVSTSVQDEAEYKFFWKKLVLMWICRLNSKSIEIAVVGKDLSFRILAQEENQTYLERLKTVNISYLEEV